VASSRYSVPAGPSRGARHFLLLVSNMGQFPELTLVHRQTTEAWLPTPGAGDTISNTFYSVWVNRFHPPPSTLVERAQKTGDLCGRSDLQQDESLTFATSPATVTSLVALRPKCTGKRKQVVLALV